MAYSKKGQLIRYNLDTKTFNEFDLPKDISSPLGMTVDPHWRFMGYKCRHKHILQTQATQEQQ